jgi:hypothetical protein
MKEPACQLAAYFGQRSLAAAAGLRGRLFPAISELWLQTVRPLHAIARDLVPHPDQNGSIRAGRRAAGNSLYDSL